MTAGAAKTTSAPAAQPNSTMAETPNANASETRPESVPSSGTGKRSATIDAARSARTPAMVAGERETGANVTGAAPARARPAAPTRPTRAMTRRGGGGRAIIVVGFPLEVVAAELVEPAGLAES